MFQSIKSNLETSSKQQPCNGFGIQSIDLIRSQTKWNDKGLTNKQKKNIVNLLSHWSSGDYYYFKFTFQTKNENSLIIIIQIA